MSSEKSQSQHQIEQGKKQEKPKKQQKPQPSEKKAVGKNVKNKAEQTRNKKEPVDEREEVVVENKEQPESEEIAPEVEVSVEEKLAELQDKYLRLIAEYDNYRKRTLKEKLDLVKSAGEDVLKDLLPIVDDFDRALQSMEEKEKNKAITDGIYLIYNKLKDFLKQQGVREIESLEQEFDFEKHEAISKLPVPDKKLKGKIVEVVQKGYYMNDKVLRYAKVVVGE